MLEIMNQDAGGGYSTLDPHKDVDIDVKDKDDVEETVREEGGWEFWGRVYEDPELRQQIQQKIMNGPTFTELMKSDELCKGELIFLNVPRIGTAQQSVVRNLVHSQLGAVPILDIVISNRKWRVRFYRYEDAFAVLKRFNNYKYKNRYLIVRFCNGADSKFGDVGDLEEWAAAEAAEAREQRQHMAQSAPPPQADPIWSGAENAEIDTFKREMVSILRHSVEGVSIAVAVDELCHMRRRGVVAAALDQWPIGLMRLCAPDVKITGRHLSLAEHNNYAALVRKAAMEGTPRVAADGWEPMPPSVVRTDYHLIDYLTAFLTHFGPQHVKIDVPFRLLARAIPGTWPTDPLDLAKHATTLSPHFILHHNVLYLASHIRHRRILLEAVQPAKPRLF